MIEFIKNNKVKILWANIMILLFTCTGCFNYREVSDLLIVSAAAVDYEESSDNIVLTVEFAMPSLGGGGEGETESRQTIKKTIERESAQSIFEAARKLSEITGKKMLWSHAEILIISREIAKRADKLQTVLNFISINPELRDTLWIAVSEEKTAGDILEASTNYEDVNGHLINNIFNNSDLASTYVGVKAWEIIASVEGKNSNFIVPLIRVKTVSLNKPNEKIPLVEGSAVFKNASLDGELTGDETMDYLFCTNKLKGGVLTVSTQLTEGNKAAVAAEILKNNTKITVSLGNPVSVKLNIKTDVAITEASENVDFKEKNDRDFLRSAIAEHICNRVKALINKMQKEYDADIFGMGMKVSQRYPKEWKELESKWSDEFTNADIQVNVDVQIKGSSLNLKTISVGE